MTEKKWLYPFITGLLYAVGFPILFIVALAESIKWNSYGMYGASAFAPLIAVIILAVIVLGVQALVCNRCVKKGKTGKSLLVKMAAVPLAVIVGLFGLLDIAMPPLLKDATSNTILYEDVVFDYQGMHEQIYARVEEFKRKNNLDESVKYSDKEFQDIFKPMYKSMNEAYHAFDALAIEIALDKPDMLKAITTGDFPINLAATLLLKTSAIKNGNDHNLSIDKIIDMNLNSVIMALLPLVSGDGPIDNAKINDVINSVLVYKEVDGIRWNIFNILGNNMLFPDIDPNAEIVQTVNGQKTVIGASLGYQDMAWLDGIPMMFFIPLMSMRVVFYVFAALLALFAAVQYYAAERYSNKFSKTFSYIMLKP